MAYTSDDDLDDLLVRTPAFQAMIARSRDSLRSTAPMPASDLLAEAHARLAEEHSGGRMMILKERYVVDENGNRIGVLLDIADYRKLLEALEELESIRAYDAAKASADEAIPFKEAVAEIERNRR